MSNTVDNSIGGINLAHVLPPIETAEAIKTEKKNTQRVKDSLESDKSEKKSRGYSAEIKNPRLEAPKSGNKNLLSANDQRVIKQEFDRYVKEKLQGSSLPQAQFEQIRHAIVNPSESGKIDKESGKIADRIGQEASDAIRKRFQLNSDWKADSSERDNWIKDKPATVERTTEYNTDERTRIVKDFERSLQGNAEAYLKSVGPELNPGVIAAIRESIKTKEPCEAAAPHYTHIYVVTVENIRAENLLPPTWHPKTESLADWKPLPPGSVDPAQATKVHLKTFINNAEKLVREMDDAAKAVAKTLPEQDTRKSGLKITGMDLFAILHEIEKNMKKMQYLDGLATKSVADKMVGRAEQEYTYKKIIAENTEKMMEKQNKTNNFVNIVKEVAFWISISITAIMLIASVVTFAVDVFSLGATAAAKAAIIPLLIGLTFTVAGGVVGLVSLLLEKFGVVEKIFKAFTDVIGSMIPDTCPKWVKDLIAYATIAAVIAAGLIFMIILTICTKGIATPAANSINGIAFRAVTHFIKEQTVTLAFLAATNLAQVGAALVIPLAKFFGASEADAQFYSACFLIVASAAFTAVIGLGTMISNLPSMARKVFRDLKRIIEDWKQVIQSANIQEGLKTILLKHLKELLAPIGELLLRISTNPNTIKAMSESTAKGLTGCSQYVAGMERNEFEKAKGVVEKSLTLAQEISSLIRKQMQKMQSDMSKTQEQVTDFSRIITDMMDKLSQSTSFLYSEMMQSKKA